VGRGPRPRFPLLLGQRPAGGGSHARQLLHDGGHGRPLARLPGRAPERERQDLAHLLHLHRAVDFLHERRVADGLDLVGAVQRGGHPAHYVRVVGERGVHRRLPGEQLQQHHAVAVHVGLHAALGGKRQFCKAAHGH